MFNYEPLNDAQWLALEHLFPEPEKRGRGKPHTPWRSVVNSVLFILTTGAKWSGLPKDAAFASKSAAHRWFVLWDKSGLLDQMLALLNQEVQTPVAVSFPLRRNRGPKVRLEEAVPASV